MTGAQNGRQRRPRAVAMPWAFALVLVTLSTSAAAHLDGGGVLPGVRGCTVLVAGMLLLWQLAARTPRSHRATMALLTLGQALAHLGYQVGGAARGAAHLVGMPGCHMGASGAVGGLRTAGAHTMLGASRGAAMAHGSHLMAMGGPPTGTGTAATGAAATATMLLCHLAAVLAGAALLAALHLLAEHLPRWLAQVAPQLTSLPAWVLPPAAVGNLRSIPVRRSATPVSRRGPPASA